MRCGKASSLLAQADSTVNDMDQLGAMGADIKSQSYFAKYLVVYLCGIYEQCIEEIIGEAARRAGNNEIANLISSQMSNTFRNPSSQRVMDLLKQCSSQWRDTFVALDQKHASALDSIVNNKNCIAHGAPCVVSLMDIKQYHMDAKQVIYTVDCLFLGP